MSVRPEEPGRALQQLVLTVLSSVIGAGLAYSFLPGRLPDGILPWIAIGLGAVAVEHAGNRLLGVPRPFAFGVGMFMAVGLMKLAGPLAA